MENDTELTWEEQVEQSNQECKRRVTNIVSDLFCELNKMGNEEKVGKFFMDAVKREHRTLQQNFFGNIIKTAIIDFAQRYDESNYDLRNEESCKMAKKLEPLIKDTYFPFI